MVPWWPSSSCSGREPHKRRGGSTLETTSDANPDSAQDPRDVLDRLEREFILGEIDLTEYIERHDSIVAWIAARESANLVAWLVARESRSHALDLSNSHS